MNGRICVIRQSIYPHELSVRREVETLCRAGFETHVISLDDHEKNPDYQPEELINGVIVHRLPLQRKKTSKARYLYDYLSFFLLSALKLSALHFKQPFDAIQVNTMPDFLVFATLIPKILGVKVVVMMQEPVPELWQTLYDSPPPRIIKMVEQGALAYADSAFTVTQQIRDKFVTRGADPSKINVILNVPEPRFFEEWEMPTESEESRNNFVLISHGAIEERYGHDTMLDAVALAKAEIPGLRLKILGIGSYLEKFLAIRAELGLEDCVDYLGYVSFPELLQALCSADVGVVAQKSSPYSNLVHTNKMYEFIALGKPVLASRLKSVEAYFGEEALRFFEPGDPRSLAEGMIDLYFSPEKRQQLAGNANELFEQYRWEKQRELYLSVYRRLLNL